MHYILGKAPFPRVVEQHKLEYNIRLKEKKYLKVGWVSEVKEGGYSKQVIGW